LHIRAPFYLELEKDGWEYVNMLCCQAAHCPEHWTIQP